MSTFEQHLSSYAELAVNVGVNIQPNQYLYISASTDATEFVRVVTEKAYDAGARQVFVDWADDVVSRLRYEKAPADSFAEFPEWKVMEREQLAEKGAAFMSIVSQSPDLLKGIDPSRIADSKKQLDRHLINTVNMFNLTKLAGPLLHRHLKHGQQKCFLIFQTSDQVTALWDAIFKAVRADQDNPVQSWIEHDNNLHEKVDYLNNKRFRKLHYTAPGTDLTVELPEGHLWCGAGSVNEKGHTFMANMPTEEVFTVPFKTGVNGYVSSTKPLSYGGNIIDNFKITFKNGRVTDVSAEQGEEVLKRLIDTDEGAKHLGEVALVPHASPISQSGLLFYNTLFDENASNHFALGSAYAFCIEGGKKMSREELVQHGLNQSITHVDFMVGSDEMDIDGVFDDGSTEPVFRSGNWAF